MNSPRKHSTIALSRSRPPPRCSYVPGTRFQLYGKVVPNTVKNFVSLLTGKNEAGVSYRGTEAYRVLDGLNIQVRGWELGVGNGRLLRLEKNMRCFFGD